MAFSDDDSWWEAGALGEAASIFGAVPRIGLVAGRVLVGSDQRLDPTCRSMAASPLGTVCGLPRVLGFVACGAVVRRTALAEVGGFDDVVGFVGEESALALDLAAIGWEIVYAPHVDGLRVQVGHSHEVGAAFPEALSRDVAGAFNLAAEPVIDTTLLAEVLGARPVPIPAPVLRSAVAASYHARLQPTPPGWLDMAVEGPIMEATRARTELGWSPRWSAPDTIRDLLEGLAAGATAPTPPLRGDVYRHRARPVALQPAPSA